MKIALINKIIIVIAFIAGWWAITYLFNMPKYILPPPQDVFYSLVNNFRILLHNATVTVIEALSGFVIANILSVFLALVISYKNKLENVVMPFAVALKTVPIVVIAPLLILWFGSGILSNIVAAMLISFFPSLVNVLRGVKSLDQELLDLFKIYSASVFQTVRFLIFPSILPYLFASLKVSSALSVIGALVGEFIGASSGLGFLIITYYYNLEVANILAVVFVISFFSIGLYYLIDLIEHKYINWKTVFD